jgi:hypothetical protein
MEKDLLFRCLDNSDNLTQDVMVKLNDTIVKYPYFLTARILQLVGSKKLDSTQYASTLEEVAALVPNRLTLYFTLNPSEKKIIDKNVEVAEKKAEEVKIEDPFTLDEEDEVKPLSGENYPIDSFEGANSKNSEQLLEFGDANESSTLEEEPYLDPLLYTLEIPKEFLDDEDYQSLSPDAPKTGKAKEKDVRRQNDILEISSGDEEKDGEQSTPNPNSLIDAFIESNPRIVPKGKPNEEPPPQDDISLDSIKEPEDAISERLAFIFMAQGLNDKAIKIYEKLCLKYPEKRVYFAARIEMLRNQPNK